MSKFHTLKVASLHKPTKESVEIAFEIPKTLKDKFAFIQGQYITLKKDIDGIDTHRCYSISSCPMDKTLAVVIKKQEMGKFSTYANEQLKVGDKLEVIPPHGNFYAPLNIENNHFYVAFASGSGITPIISIIETTLRTEPRSRFMLFYGNKKTGTIIFHERLEALKNQFINRFSLYHILSKEKQEIELFNGQINSEKITSFATVFFPPMDVNQYFICGPEEMILTVKETLIEMKVPEKRILMELFSSPSDSLKKKKVASSQEKASAEITVILNGNSITFPYNSTKSILDVAYEHEISLPYACKGGVCSTCICHLEEGEVRMDVNYSLEPSELAKGLILSCQSFPKTDKITLNFDI